MTDKMSIERIREIRAATEGVTPGPWSWGAKFICQRIGGDYKPFAECLPGDYDSTSWQANAAHLANCDPDTIRSLCDLALAARIGAVEPVAHRYRDRRPPVGKWLPVLSKGDLKYLSARPEVYEVEPLYASPPPVVPQGMKLVPVEPTPEMIEAARINVREGIRMTADALDTSLPDEWGKNIPALFSTAYRTMLAASPPASAAPTMGGHCAKCGRDWGDMTTGGWAERIAAAEAQSQQMREVERERDAMSIEWNRLIEGCRSALNGCGTGIDELSGQLDYGTLLNALVRLRARALSGEQKP